MVVILKCLNPEEVRSNVLLNAGGNKGLNVFPAIKAQKTNKITFLRTMFPQKYELKVVHFDPY